MIITWLLLHFYKWKFGKLCSNDSIITYYAKSSLLRYHYTIITSLLENYVIMIPLLRIMQRVVYYVIIAPFYYVIITPDSIITHYYLFQSPKLADGGLQIHVEVAHDDSLTSASELRSHCFGTLSQGVLQLERSRLRSLVTAVDLRGSVGSVAQYVVSSSAPLSRLCC